MIPDRLKVLVEQQLGDVHRTDRQSVENALAEIGVPLNSEFAEFFLTYTITLFRSSVSTEQLCDIAEPTNEIALGTNFVHEVWELPRHFICLSSVEGEGAYLYDLKTGQVFDFDLSERENLLNGVTKPKWDSFFNFMIWYLEP